MWAITVRRRFGTLQGRPTDASPRYTRLNVMFVAPSPAHFRSFVFNTHSDTRTGRQGHCAESTFPVSQVEVGQTLERASFPPSGKLLTRE